MVEKIDFEYRLKWCPLYVLWPTGGQILVAIIQKHKIFLKCCLWKVITFAIFPKMPVRFFFSKLALSISSVHFDHVLLGCIHIHVIHFLFNQSGRRLKKWFYSYNLESDCTLQMTVSIEDGVELEILNADPSSISIRGSRRNWKSRWRRRRGSCLSDTEDDKVPKHVFTNFISMFSKMCVCDTKKTFSSRQTKNIRSSRVEQRGKFPFISFDFFSL